MPQAALSQPGASEVRAGRGFPQALGSIQPLLVRHKEPGLESAPLCPAQSSRAEGRAGGSQEARLDPSVGCPQKELMCRPVQVFGASRAALGRRGHFWVGRAALPGSQWL